MVVACPCALGLATTAILVYWGWSRSGLLIKGGDVLERVHQLDTVVFDKTGTLTTGHPTVTDCQFPISHPDALMQLAAAAESGTCHPLAAALAQSAQRQLPIPAAMDFTRNWG